MGFSFRGKSLEQPVVISEIDRGISSATDTPAADLKKFRKLHQFDPFLDLNKLDRVDDVLAAADPEKEAVVEEELIVDDSPYPEVRSAVRTTQQHAVKFESSNVLTISTQTQVPPTDDVETPVNTVRAWTIGMLLCTIIAAVNILMGLRKSPVVITASVVQLIAYPYVLYPSCKL